jgi:hypothetical protein
MKVPNILPMVSIPGFHYTPLTTATTSLSSTSTAIPTPPVPCIDISVTDYSTNGSLSVSLTRDDSLECYLLRYSPESFQHHGGFFDLSMKCLDNNVKATLKEPLPTIADGNELFVDYFAEDGTEISFQMSPLTKEQWLVEDGAIYKKYHDSAGCGNTNS